MRPEGLSSDAGTPEYHLSTLDVSMRRIGRETVTRAQYGAGETVVLPSSYEAPEPPANITRHLNGYDPSFDTDDPRLLNNRTQRHFDRGFREPSN